MKKIAALALLFSLALTSCKDDCALCPPRNANDNRKIVVKVPDGKGFYFVYEFMKRDTTTLGQSGSVIVIRTKEKEYRFGGNFIYEEDR
jgi:hypothetical protein